MALTYSQIISRVGSDIQTIYGTADTDATVFPNSAGSTTAGNGTVTGVTGGTSFTANRYVFVTGATAQYMNLLAGTASTTLSFNSAFRPVTESVTITQMEYVLTGDEQAFTIRGCEWIDETNGITWTWQEGMPQCQVRKYVWATGVTTSQKAGLLVLNNLIAVGQDVAPVSSKFRYKLWG